MFEFISSGILKLYFITPGTIMHKPNKVKNIQLNNPRQNIK